LFCTAKRGTVENVKAATSFRLSEEALVLLARIAAEMGISQAAVLELAIREFAGKTSRRER
jgi:hypothetical protein